jgi:hypothetical protein
VKGKHSGVHQNPSQNNDPPHLKERRRKRRCGGRSRVRPRPVLQDKPTNGKNDGEKSCTSDFKQRALAKGKLVFISYLFSAFQHFLCTLFVFLYCMFEIFKIVFCMLEFSLSLFPFYKNTKNIF